MTGQWGGRTLGSPGKGPLQKKGLAALGTDREREREGERRRGRGRGRERERGKERERQRKREGERPITTVSRFPRSLTQDAIAHLKKKRKTIEQEQVSEALDSCCLMRALQWLQLKLRGSQLGVIQVAEFEGRIFMTHWFTSNL